MELTARILISPQRKEWNGNLPGEIDMHMRCRMKTFAFAFLVAAVPSVVSAAHAHSWYSERIDPVFRQSCCGGSDCAQLVISAEVLTAEERGYHIRLTLEQTRRINPHSSAPIDAIVTWERVQPSEDGNYHICLMTTRRDNERGGIYCLFAPPNT
jgi:hypothetical protein